MTNAETRGTFAVIDDLMRDVHLAEEALREEQDAALRRYVERVDAILAFAPMVAEDRDDEDHDPTHLLDSLRGHFGELRLQTRLGAMEGEEIVERVRAALHRLTT